MRCYSAPMEGLTGYVFRNAHRRWFGGVEAYFTPFLGLKQEHRFQKRDLRDILPENNGDTPVIPQVLTKSARDFLWAAGELKAMGYRRIDLNLGCPSGTVVAKGKGAGLLADPEGLDRFLGEIFEKAPTEISVKTRLGLEDPAEFPALLEVFQRYPIAELTIHPRVRADFYKGPVRLDAFEAACEDCRLPLCYNGDLFTAADCLAFAARFLRVERVMLGRGLVGDPALARKASGGPGADKETLRAFHDALYEGYAACFDSLPNAVIRMKEHWFYFLRLFQEGDRLGKAIRKAATPQAYEAAVAAVFSGLDLRADWGEAGP